MDYDLTRRRAPSLVAALIVKNEAAVLQRCLDSLTVHVDHIVINDNGSTDDTPRIIDAYGCVPVPGKWVDFAHNRNLVLEAARSHGDYILCGIDADEELVVPKGYKWPALELDAYSIDVHLEGLVYPRTAIVSSRHPWEWRYPVQEGLYSNATRTPPFTGYLPGIYIKSYRGEGARAKDPETQKKDLALLQSYVSKHPNDPRMTFYLAQQYKDMGKLEFAAQLYSERLANATGYQAERWYSQFMLGRIDDWRGMNPLLEYMKAFEMDPARAEPMFYAADYCRKEKQNATAFTFASTAAMLTRPSNGLFVERDIYDWRALDLIATVAWYTPFRDAGRAASNLLIHQPYPDAHAKRIMDNHAYYTTSTPTSRPAMSR